MADYDNRLLRGAATTADTMDMGLRAHMLRVYNYMTAALALTGVVAYVVANTPALLGTLYHMTPQGLQPTILGWVVMFAPIGMVLLLSFRINHMSQGAAQATFWAYAALMGASLSSILLIYTGASVALTFFVTAATFGTMSLYGYTTKRDLTAFGSFLFMGLIGLLIASLANMFFQSPMVSFVVSVLGVLIFTGLTAWDTQKIKNTYYEVGHDGALAGKAAVMGALALYLDFINIFLFLLRFMGDRK
ncbi:MAG TPA: Bax inhibitor-1/YccA family protein [Rhizomicrobium sp.]|jgi:FtsH-binding integral membrane protein|nr:Bax inhibitor-1/YccA family protein [Rhizomicrobium sp.]